MRAMMFALLILVAPRPAAFAQTPQNPEACARLQADLSALVRNLMVNGQRTLPQAMEAARQVLEMRRMTGDPCYLPPPAQPVPAPPPGSR
jgi:hypothetical protein